MVFSTIPFLYYFIPITILLYFLVPFKLKNIVLLITSLFFYFWGEPVYVIIMVVSSIIAYIFGLLIDKYREKKKLSKALMIISVLISFLFLGIFKYSDFLIANINTIVIDNLNKIFKNLALANLALLKIALPAGISFYTFQIASYTIDLYRGNVKVQKNPLKFLTYVSMFPQLIAGPIVRYSDIEKEIDERKITINDVAYGIRRFIIGLSKKVLIADVLYGFCDIVKTSKETSILFMWAYIIAYALFIYFDFSGYSDMAIGIGKILGFNFPENFNYPYISKSITEFWRRWHMTLGGWFRDYIYIPLGGNRVSKIKWLRNIAIVWAFTGLWHGASWNFVLWGLFFAVLLVIEKLFLNKLLDKIPKIFSWLYTIFFILISWVIFDATSIAEIGYRLSVMFGLINIPAIKASFGITGSIPFVNSETLYYLKSYLIIFIIGIIGATPIAKNIISKLRDKKVENNIINVLEIFTVTILLIVSTSYLIDGSFSPFIYFRF